METTSPITTLTDDSLMPWGIYKGQKMANVPAHYLLWVRNNMKWGGKIMPVINYTTDNLEILQKEVQNGK